MEKQNVQHNSVQEKTCLKTHILGKGKHVAKNNHLLKIIKLEPQLKINLTNNIQLN